MRNLGPQARRGYSQCSSKPQYQFVGGSSTQKVSFESCHHYVFLQLFGDIGEDSAVSIPVMVSTKQQYLLAGSTRLGRKMCGFFFLSSWASISASSPSTPACYTCYRRHPEAGTISSSSNCNTIRLSSSSPDSLHQVTSGKPVNAWGFDRDATPDDNIQLHP